MPRAAGASAWMAYSCAVKRSLALLHRIPGTGLRFEEELLQHGAERFRVDASRLEKIERAYKRWEEQESGETQKWKMRMAIEGRNSSGSRDSEGSKTFSAKRRSIDPRRGYKDCGDTSWPKRRAWNRRTRQ